MLELKFSHLKYAKVLNIGGLPLRPCEHTYLLDCCVVNELDEDMIEYDTRWYPLGECFEKHAQYFKLKPGPYLVLFLKTVTEGCEKRPHYWTTIRTPWSRVKKDCLFCQRDLEECWNDYGLTKCVGWIPTSVPQKYCDAIGKEVRIIYSGDEKEEVVMPHNLNFSLRPIIKDIGEKEAREGK